MPSDDAWIDATETMLREHIVARGVRDRRLLDAMRGVPREWFVPPHLRADAYDDTPLPLGHGQTISQPYIVARMLELLRLRGDERVLEIGTGSGYVTAIVARLVSMVYSAELEPDLARTVGERLARLGITNVVLGVGDGLRIFADRAPFDAIVSAAAPAELPPEIVDQLADGGRAVLPIGGELQDLWVIERRGEQIVKRAYDPVQFVPLRR